MRRIKKAMLALVGCAVLAAPLQAAVTPKGSPVRDKEYRNPALYVPSMHTPLSALKSQTLAAQLQQELASLNVPESGAFYDVAADRWGSLILSEPLGWVQALGAALIFAGIAIARPRRQA